MSILHTPNRDRSLNGRRSPLEDLPDRCTPGPTKVAYIVARFPKLTETFILYEILALENHDVRIELYPLLREHVKVMHPEAAPLVERAHFQSYLSWAVLRAHLHFIKRKPQAYLSALWRLLCATWGSFRFFTGALALFPKAVYFARRIRPNQVQHIHAHFASHPAATAFVIHRLVGVPYSFTAHGSDLHRDRHMLREKVAEASFVVAISEYNKELILAECGEEFRDKIVVIHCGVDTNFFGPSQQASHPAESQHIFTILCIGTLHEVKGQTYLLEACQLLRQRGINFKCYLVGAGQDRNMLLEQIKRRKLGDCLELLGPRTHEDIAKLLSQADIVAAPSVETKSGKREGIPVVLMEAMASGLPVVASRISGIPELVEDGVSGLLVPPRNASALADALECLYSDPALRHRLAVAAREKVLREFDIDRNAELLAQHFRQASYV